MNPKNQNTSGTGASPPRTFNKAGVIGPQLGVHPKTLARWADRGYIHRYKPNARVVLFDEAEVEQFMSSVRIPTPNASA